MTLAYTGDYWLASHHVARSRTAVGQHNARQHIVLISGEPDTPGHTYRVVHLAEAAKRLGMTAAIIRIEDVPDQLDAIRAAGTLIIWRARYTQAIIEAMVAAREREAAVLFDVDDLMADPRIADARLVDAIRWENHDVEEVKRYYASIHDSRNAADATICTTEELAVHLRWKDYVVHVLRNGFSDATLVASRLAVRRRRMSHKDGLIRIGYAAGTRTHQRDFAPAAEALGDLLRERDDCRLVLFRHPVWGPILDADEFPSLSACNDKIEWRNVVALQQLPDELARLDINLAPLETGNMFCEAKSELKFFEAAIADVCTVASPTGPFRRAIRDGETGFLADSADEWYDVLLRLADNPILRQRVAAAAYLDVLWPFGPEQRAERLAAILAQTRPGREAANAFQLDLHRASTPRPPLPRVPLHEVVHFADRMGQAEATVVIPLYNYGHYVKEALESARAQIVELLDLVVVDDHSSDDSLAVTLDWMRERGERFNRVVVLRNMVNSGLGAARNAGFATAETPFVLPLDADNRLLPHCLPRCLHAIMSSGAAFVYPQLRQFGESTNLLCGATFAQMRFSGGNYVDALALVAKSAWAGVGGFTETRTGWEDYDFWCRMVERGHWGQAVDEELAEYRVHHGSMLHTLTETAQNKATVVSTIQAQHAWLTVQRVLETEARVQGLAHSRAERNDVVEALPWPHAAS